MMQKSKVYYINVRGPMTPEGPALSYGGGFIDKLRIAFSKIADCIESGDHVAIKTHLGAEGAIGNIRPSIIRAIVEMVKEAGGYPFVTDACTIPAYGLNAERALASDYLAIAASNGFTSQTLGCPLIIADGSFGTDDLEVEINGHQLRRGFVARAIADADAMIVVTHIKGGHGWRPFGASVKNVGVGCASKRGKHMLHGAFRIFPKVNKEECPGKRGCEWSGTCEQGCPEGAIKVTDGGVEIDVKQCNYCGTCARFCGLSGHGAIRKAEGYDKNLSVSIADSAAAIIKTFREGKIGYLNLMMDVVAYCDCSPWYDNPMIANVGILASKDVVAVDQATLDFLAKAPALPSSLAEDTGIMEHGEHRLNKMFGTKIAPIELEAAEKLGLGSRDYELIEVQPKLTKPYPFVTRLKVIKKIYKTHHPLAELRRRPISELIKL